MENQANNKQTNKIKNHITNFFARRDPLEYFIALMVFSIVVFAIFTIFLRDRNIQSLFFINGIDKFMDFFNSVRDVSQGTGAYTERTVIYPPMANLIFLVCEKLMPNEYTTTSFDLRKSWVNYPSCIVVFVIFMFLCLALYYYIHFREVKSLGVKGVIFSIFILINVSVFYLVERGNIVLLSMCGASFFIFNYNSENKILKELSLVALAFSFSIKLYPAMLGWVLVVNKDWKSIIRLVIYALVFLIVPSFFFGGPKCFIWLFENIKSFSSSKVEIDAVDEINLSKLKIYRGLYVIFRKFTSILSYVLILVFLVAPFFMKSEWKVVLLGCAALFSVPSVTSLYAWIIFLIPLIAFMKTEKLRGINWVYFFAIIIPFLFIPKFISLDFLVNPLTLNSCAVIICSIVIGIALIVDCCIIVVKSIKEKKLNKLQ